MDVNLKLETKVNDQMEDVVLAKATIIENHRKLHDYKKLTIENMVDNMKANGARIAPRSQEPSSKKLGTAKDKMISIEEGIYIKARQSIKPNQAQASIKSNNF